MEDWKIIDLYWSREQAAIAETEAKYGAYCHHIAWNILRDHRDSEECVNDTWMKAWNSMPSERPGILSAFLGAITRNLSLDCYRKRHAKKRGEGEVMYVFEELQDCFSKDGPEQQSEADALVEVLNSFLEKQQKENRMIFVRRYWYMDSIEGIAKHYGISESKVKSSLFRSRNKLRDFLQKEGFEV